jgi:hypothetical protein
MADEQEPPVQGYIFGKLTKQEEDALMRRALRDQDVFDELWDAADERAVLQDPVYRARLLRLLEEVPQPRGLAALWANWTAGARGLALAGAACLALAAVLLTLRPGTQGVDQALSLTTDPKTDLTAFFRLPPRDPSRATLKMNASPAVYRPGDPVRATLHLNAPGAVFLLQRGPSGAPRLVYPADLTDSADLAPGDIAVVFDPVPPTTDVTARQTVTLRIIVLPQGRDLRTQAIDWTSVRDVYAAHDMTYSVVP